MASSGNIQPVLRIGRLRGALTPALSRRARGQEGRVAWSASPQPSTLHPPRQIRLVARSSSLAHRLQHLPAGQLDQVTCGSNLVDHRDGGLGEQRRGAAAQPLQRQVRVEVARCVAEHIQQVVAERFLLFLPSPGGCAHLTFYFSRRGFVCIVRAGYWRYQK